MSEPEHVLRTDSQQGEDCEVWYIERCKCGWFGDPKLTEFAAMDDGAAHVEPYCGG